ncbi:elicitor-responsive protein 3-like isoform X1 [Pyrus communis]|uniref:elicitor-responsive protein 3-like isoform X1 n=1 Tax=Pyrus communis TaxID=23211 RepID=UPI0035BFA238
MPRGTLEVNLVNAKGLKNTEFFGNMDPYVIITCKKQQKKSKVATAQGSNPEWNESFVFGVADGVTELHLMIMDKDTGSADDFVGELSIPLRTIYEEGKLPPMKYNVLRNKKYRGEIKIGFTFTPAVTNDRELEFVGGWKESSY